MLSTHAKFIHSHLVPPYVSMLAVAFYILFSPCSTPLSRSSSGLKMSSVAGRTQVLQNFRTQIEHGQIIVGAGAGIGLSAKFIEQGGGDLIIIYNSGRYRMAGRGSLAGLMPYGNANDVVLEMVLRSHISSTSHSTD